MNLTEPQAGSDLAAVRTRATPEATASTDLFGQKIFITYGEHDLTENIVHLVLARIAGAPEGRASRCSWCPKFLVNATARSARATTCHCVSLEHKLGIHARPTA